MRSGGEPDSHATLASADIHAAIMRELVAVKAFGARVVHYSVQADHPSV